MTTVKTYVWLDPERLKFINDNPKVVSLLYDLGLLPEEISARVRGYVEEERERCAKLVEDWAKAYPASMFGEPEFGKHGPTVDSCSAKALRTILPTIAEEIRGHELDQPSDSSKGGK